MIASTSSKIVWTLRTVSTVLIMAFLTSCAKSPKAEPPLAATTGQSVAQNETQVEVKETPQTMSAVTPIRRVPTPIVRPQHPVRYTVKKGDTLWGIANVFLKTPWYWPEIWHVNTQINNPHLIYPGDVISLVYIDGKPQLLVSDRAVSMQRGEKLSPRIRVNPLGESIDSIPLDAVEQFMAHPRVIAKEELERSPYIIGNFDGRLISALGDEIYARGVKSQDDSLFTVFRSTKTLVDPTTQEILGYEVMEVADAKMIDFGDPATLQITKNIRETLNGDRLLPQDRSQMAHNYFPKRPKQPVTASVISLFDAISTVALNQIVVVNIGLRDGAEVGDVLAVERRGGRVKDEYSGKKDDYVTLPNTRAGVIMIFQTFERVSYGLIMASTRPIHLNDLVTNL